MRHGFGQHVEDAFIEIGFLSAYCQADFFSACLGDITHDAREATEKMLHRNHADLHHGLLQIVQNTSLKGESVAEL